MTKTRVNEVEWSSKPRLPMEVLAWADPFNIRHWWLWHVTVPRHDRRLRRLYNDMQAIERGDWQP